eukprot:403768_1
MDKTFNPKPKSEWMADSSSNNCIVCKNVIVSTFLKSNKHHCRYCANIVCDQCSQNKINDLRSCNQCYRSFSNQNSIENKHNDEINDTDHMQHYQKAFNLFTQKAEYNQAYHEMLQSWEINDQLDISQRVELFGYICVTLDKNEEFESFMSKLIIKHPNNIKCNFWYAKALSDMDKFNEAELAYKKLFSLQPDECFLGYGLVLAKQKKFEEALQYTEKQMLLRIDDTDNHDVLFEHALVLFDMKKYEEACVYIGQVINCNDTIQLNEYYQDKYYECLVKLERFNDAVIFSAKMVKRFEGKMKYRLQYASDLNREKRYNESIDEYIQCLEFDPENVTAFCRLIWIFIHQKQYEQAQKYASKMLDVLPQNGASFAMNGHVTFAMKQYDHCKGFRKKAIELDGLSLSYKWYYLDVLLAMSQYEEAKLICDEVIKNNPESWKAHWYGHMIYAEQFDMNRAQIHAEKLILLDPNNPLSYYWNACGFFELNEPEKAMELLKTALMKKKQSHVLRFYGVIMRDEGDLKGCEQYFIDAIALEKDEHSQESYRSRGHLCFVRNQLEESCKYFRQAIDTYYANPYVHYWLSISLMFLNEFKQAEISFKNALRIRPRYPRCHHELGLLLIKKLSKFDEGLKHLKQANEIFPNNQQYILSLEKYTAFVDDDKGNIKLVLDTYGKECQENVVMEDLGNVQMVVDTELKESDESYIQEPGMNVDECDNDLADITEEEKYENNNEEISEKQKDIIVSYVHEMMQRRMHIIASKHKIRIGEIREQFKRLENIWRESRPLPTIPKEQKVSAVWSLFSQISTQLLGNTNTNSNDSNSITNSKAIDAAKRKRRKKKRNIDKEVTLAKTETEIELQRLELEYYKKRQTINKMEALITEQLLACDDMSHIEIWYQNFEDFDLREEKHDTLIEMIENKIKATHSKIMFGKYLQNSPFANDMQEEAKVSDHEITKIAKLAGSTLLIDMVNRDIAKHVTNEDEKKDTQSVDDELLQFELRLDDDWSNWNETRKLQLQKELAQKFDVDASTLQFVSAREGCIIVNFTQKMQNVRGDTGINFQFGHIDPKALHDDIYAYNKDWEDNVNCCLDYIRKKIANPAEINEEALYVSQKCVAIIVSHHSQDHTQNVLDSNFLTSDLDKGLYKEIMNPKWDRAYGQGQDKTHWTGKLRDGRSRGGDKYPYYCPSGWKRYAVKVDGDFDQKYGNWPICYHGSETCAIGSILSHGIYGNWPGTTNLRFFSPSIVYSAHPRYARPKLMNDRQQYVQMIFQCRVDPNAMYKCGETLRIGRSTKIDSNFSMNFQKCRCGFPNPKWGYSCNVDGHNEMEWFLDITDADKYVIYGIMLRFSNDPSILPESSWWRGHWKTDWKGK